MSRDTEREICPTCGGLLAGEVMLMEKQHSWIRNEKSGRREEREKEREEKLVIYGVLHVDPSHVDLDASDIHAPNIPQCPQSSLSFISDNHHPVITHHSSPSSGTA